MSYDTVANANTYFESKLHVQNWTIASDSTKTKALAEATVLIDRLRFRGYMVDEDQTLEFPRYYDYDEGPDGTETIPDDIKYACFEIALQLVNGFDLEKEVKNKGILSRKFEGVSTTYLSNRDMEHLNNGIPSILAWNYLKPYLAYCKSIRLTRKS